MPDRGDLVDCSADVVDAGIAINRDLAGLEVNLYLAGTGTTGEGSVDAFKILYTDAFV